MVLEEVRRLNVHFHLAFLVQRILLFISMLWLKVRLFPLVFPLHNNITDFLRFFAKYFEPGFLILSGFNKISIRDGFGLAQKVAASWVLIVSLNHKRAARRYFNLFKFERLLKTCCFSTVLMRLRSEGLALVNEADEGILFAKGVAVVLEEVGLGNLQLNVTVRVWS